MSLRAGRTTGTPGSPAGPAASADDRAATLIATSPVAAGTDLARPLESTGRDTAYIYGYDPDGNPVIIDADSDRPSGRDPDTPQQ
jgi:hypothetical protein